MEKEREMELTRGKEIEYRNTQEPYKKNELSQREKEQLGLLIQYYRQREKKQETVTSYNKQDFVKDFVTGESICSVKTLYNIERGIGVKNIDIYELLLRNLNMSYKQNSKYDASIGIVEALLYKGLTSKKKKYFLEVEEYLKENEEMKESIIYSEFYQCCKFITNYELYRKYGLDFEHFLLISSIFPNTMSFMMAYTLHEINCETLVLQDIYFRCDEVIKKYKEEKYLFTLHQAHCSLYSEEVKKAYDLFRKIYKTLDSQEEKEGKIVLLVLIARIESILDIKYTLSNRLPDIEEKIHTLDLTGKTLFEIYLTLGILYFDNEDYRQSIDFFERAEAIDPLAFPLYAPYYYHGKEKLEEEIVLRQESIAREYYPHYYPFAHFYTLKYSDYSHEYMLSYLLDTILPRLKIAHMGKSLERIFFNESIAIGIKTRKYQTVVEYLSNFFK